MIIGKENQMDKSTDYQGAVLKVNADARRIPLQDESVNCCVTSPPYFGLRDYNVEGADRCASI